MIDKIRNALSPRQWQVVISVLGSVIATLPATVDALEPYAVIFAGIGAAMGGAAWARRPGDVKGPKP